MRRLKPLLSSLFFKITAIYLFACTFIFILFKFFLKHDEDVLILNALSIPFYTIIAYIMSWKKVIKRKYFYPLFFPLWIVGALSLNESINIFENLTVWVYVVFLLFSISNVILYWRFNNVYLKQTSVFINGFSFFIIVYFVIFLGPIAPFGILALILLGIGFFTLAPMIIAFSHIKFMIINIFKVRKNLMLWLAGFSLNLIAIAFITFNFYQFHQIVRLSIPTGSFEKQDEDIPNWLSIAQKLDNSAINMCYLEQGLVYHNEFIDFGSTSFMDRTRQYNKQKIHDPILNFSFLFSPELAISDDDKIKILQINHDQRLETEEQLWRGDQLQTSDIKEDIQIFPNKRLAYNEYTMLVETKHGSKTWSDQEAIYSFQLPEGSVATSLSLWVNGIERKGVLTSKSKAESAYKQIVGVEARDPSLMQWREGNRVSVRVFPINDQLPRTFKVGFTTPLKFDGKKLVFENIAIKGPEMAMAKTITRLQLEDVKTHESSTSFEETTEDFYEKSSNGFEKWSTEIDATKLDEVGFVYQNHAFLLSEPVLETVQMPISEVIIDLSKEWKLSEIEKLIASIKQPIYVYQSNKKTKIDKNNYKKMYEKYQAYHFTLPAFQYFKKDACVITKSGSFSPTIDEIKDTPYYINFHKSLRNNKIKVVNFSNKMSPFWQTLKERNDIFWQNETFNDLPNLINNQSFKSVKLDDESCYIAPSNVVISDRIIENKIAKKPNNHIFRLYAFGQVMRDYQLANNEENRYLDLAKKANIVTPISSLIVLETDEDYKTHNIDKNPEGIGNAEIGGEGGAPLPNQWFLFILIMLIWLFNDKIRRFKFGKI